MLTAEYVSSGVGSSRPSHRFRNSGKGEQHNITGYEYKLYNITEYESYDEMIVSENITSWPGNEYDEVMQSKEVESMDTSLQKKLLMLRLIPLIICSGVTFVVTCLLFLSFWGVYTLHPLTALMVACIFGSLTYSLSKDLLRIGINQ